MLHVAPTTLLQLKIIAPASLCCQLLKAFHINAPRVIPHLINTTTCTCTTSTSPTSTAPSIHFFVPLVNQYLFLKQYYLYGYYLNDLRKTQEVNKWHKQHQTVMFFTHQNQMLDRLKQKTIHNFYLDICRQWPTKYESNASVKAMLSKSDEFSVWEPYQDILDSVRFSFTFCFILLKPCCDLNRMLAHAC